MTNPQPIAYPHIGCEHCRGVSRNVIPYHRRGCATGKGGWSEAQRRGIEAITARVVQEERNRPRRSLGWAGVCP